MSLCSLPVYVINVVFLFLIAALHCCLFITVALFVDLSCGNANNGC
jgi:hypothetical protein